MRLTLLAPLLVLPLLAACDSNQPKPAAEAPAAGAPAATKPAVTVPAATAAAGVPVGARPMLGNWAADVATCGTDRMTVIAATSYAEGGNSCKLALTDNKDGTFKAICDSREFNMTPIFGPSGEGVRISAGGKSQVIYRCRK